jgi:hypothetical protein
MTDIVFPPFMADDEKVKALASLDDPFDCAACGKPVLKFADVMRDRTEECEPTFCAPCNKVWHESPQFAEARASGWVLEEDARERFKEKMP